MTTSRDKLVSMAKTLGISNADNIRSVDLKRQLENAGVEKKTPLLDYSHMFQNKSTTTTNSTTPHSYGPVRRSHHSPLLSSVKEEQKKPEGTTTPKLSFQDIKVVEYEADDLLKNREQMTTYFTHCGQRKHLVTQRLQKKQNTVKNTDLDIEDQVVLNASIKRDEKRLIELQKDITKLTRKLHAKIDRKKTFLKIAYSDSDNEDEEFDRYTSSINNLKQLCHKFEQI